MKYSCKSICEERIKKLNNAGLTAARVIVDAAEEEAIHVMSCSNQWGDNYQAVKDSIIEILCEAARSGSFPNTAKETLEKEGRMTGNEWLYGAVFMTSRWFSSLHEEYKRT